MRDKRKNEFLKSDSIIPNEDDYDKLIETEEKYNESARMKILVMIFIIPLFLILGFIFKSKFNPEYQQEKLEEYKAKQLVETNNKKLLESNQLISDAEEAFIIKDFNKAVFLYRQAISYHPKNISILEKLILTLEESCKNENEIHCNAIEKAKEKLEKFKKMEEIK